ncbi:MAG: ORF6N domain-containing protein [Deltaproteobacteria bacterium]|nr:ORF6N domain-containing protein [Deltaproteobacteria bacterium]
MVEEITTNLNLLIVVIRGRKVMLSPHLAELYGVEPKALLQAVKRNLERFPADFMFQITAEELYSLRSQIVTLENNGKGKHSKYLPYAFTQEGVAMLSSVLRSPRAIQANVAIMRTFVKLREMMLSHQELSRKIETLERKYDAQFKVVFKSIKELIDAKPEDLLRIPSKKKIGFGRD